MGRQGAGLLDRDTAPSRYHACGLGVRGHHYRLDRAVAVRQSREIGGVDALWHEHPRLDVSALRMDGVDDVWLTVHAILQAALVPMAQWRDIAWDDEASIRRAMPFAERAATHLLEDADLWDACDAIQGICNAGYRMLDPDGVPHGEDFYGIPDYEEALDYVRGYARPALEALAPAAEEDLDALASLAPGGPG